MIVHVPSYRTRSVRHIICTNEILMSLTVGCSMHFCIAKKKTQTKRRRMWFLRSFCLALVDNKYKQQYVPRNLKRPCSGRRRPSALVWRHVRRLPHQVINATTCTLLSFIVLYYCAVSGCCDCYACCAPVNVACLFTSIATKQSKPERSLPENLRCFFSASFLHRLQASPHSCTPLDEGSNARVSIMQPRWTLKPCCNNSSSK